MADPYQQEDPNKLRDQIFNTARQRAQQQIGAQQQESTDALRRRFAAMGGLSSGASIKQEQMLRDKGDQLRETANQGIGAQEAEAKLGDAREAAARAFQSGEAQKGRDFTSREALIGRDFQSGEQEKARNFQRSLKDQDMAFQQKVFDFEAGSKLRQLDMADRQFAIDKDVAEFNKMIAQQELQRANRGLLGNLGRDIFGTGGSPVERGLIGGGVGSLFGPVGTGVGAVGGAVSGGGK